MFLSRVVIQILFVLSLTLSSAWGSDNYTYKNLKLVPLDGYAAQTVKDHKSTRKAKRFVLMSDLHNLAGRFANHLMGYPDSDDMKQGVSFLPEGDFLIIAGDFTNLGLKSEIKKFIQFLEETNRQGKYTHILIVAGNHEITFDKGRFKHKNRKRYKVQLKSGFDFLGSSNPIRQYFIENLPENAHYLEDDQIILEGLKFYGSPWVTTGGAFGFKPADSKDDFLKQRWSQIPSDIDVLITHSPAKNIGDAGGRYSCEYLRERVDELDQLKLHVFGHIHNGHGVTLRSLEGAEISGKTYFVNSAIKMGAHQFNSPIVLDLDL